MQPDILTQPDVVKQPVLIQKEGIKFGIITGLLAIIILYGTWAAGIDIFVQFLFVGTWVPYIFAILLFAGFALRKRLGGYITFQEGLKFAFISYVISGLLIALATYVLYNFVDKDLTEKSFQKGLDKVRHFMEQYKASEEDIDKAMENAEKSKTETGLKTVFLGYGLGLIWAFAESAVIAVIIKKENKQPF
ncbi:Protein of unknown function [Filimonas lacunae]|uniref:DUF4199 domain-containing protein n=1 Tax=Filimonas lacunae TaxID=477680 RepID=A0A173MFK7_9BACT|nr:DUF4199 domain-containing protein [Filimonas lacunae]BAV06267.1 hypothetical protein FLA_2283 [Filimonas lacunae]SIT25559.1 Protein of unknown function [Filimonas lacunae]